jgi:hypothetical protein
MNLASAFLCHSSAQGDFVDQIATQLGRRGVVPWLDKDRLRSGADLPSRLKQAVREQAIVAVLLSSEAAASRWVEEELHAAFDTIDGSTDIERIVPICDGNPVELIRQHRILRDKWLHADGKRVVRNYVDLANVPPGKDRAAYVADAVAVAVYEHIRSAKARVVAIGIDQRGNGDRRGDSFIPEPIRQLEAPVLVFRPDRGRRSETEVLRGDEWEAFAVDVLDSLSRALGSRNSGQKEVYLFGDGQLGLPLLIGYGFFNSQRADRVVCHNMRDGRRFFFDFQRDQLPSGAADRAGANAPQAPEVALYLGKHDSIPTIGKYLKAQGWTGPLEKIEHDEGMEQGQVLQLIADAIAMIQAWQKERGTEHVRLFCDLPFGAMALLGGHLVNKLDGCITYMEYRKDLQNRRPAPRQGQWYVALPMRVDPSRARNP